MIFQKLVDRNREVGAFTLTVEENDILVDAMIIRVAGIMGKTQLTEKQLVELDTIKDVLSSLIQVRNDFVLAIMENEEE